MKRIIIFLYLLGVVLTLSGQNDYLSLAHKKPSKNEIIIPEGKMVKIKSILPGNETLKGRLEILSDSGIVVGKDSILVNNIKKIMIRSGASTAIGGVASGVGIGITVWGIHELSAFVLSAEPLIALFQLFGGVLLVGVIGAGIIYTVVGISVVNNGFIYKTAGRSGYTIRVGHKTTTLTSGGNSFIQTGSRL